MRILLTKLTTSRFLKWLLIPIALFALLRAPSLIEPYWYGDEGIYQVIGQALAQGKQLYIDIWDNKPPLLYIFYAIASGDQLVMRTASFLFGIVSVIVFGLLAKLLFKDGKTALLCTGLFAFLFGSPLVEGNIANAENFMILPTLICAFLLYQQVTKASSFININKHLLFLIGVIMGTVFLIKTVALFDVLAFGLFISIFGHISFKKVPHRIFVIQLIKTLIPLYCGFIIPTAIALLYYFTISALPEFINAAFLGNVSYVEFENSLWGVPHGLLYLKIVLLIATIASIFIFAKSLPHHVLFIVLWLAFAVFSTAFSGRPYTHYLLLSVPAFCLLVGIIIASKTMIIKIISGAMVLLLLYIASYYSVSPSKALYYYSNTVSFLRGTISNDTYRAFFDQTTPRDYELASLLSAITDPGDQVYIWGDHPQIYALSNIEVPTRYVVAYHIVPSKERIQETQEQLNTIKPRFVVLLDEAQPLPFDLSLYIIRYRIDGAAIYERVN